MSGLASADNPAQMVRVLLQSMQRNDRGTIVTQLVEIGIWLSVTPDPLPPPDVMIVSSAALTITLNELRSIIKQHRDFSAGIPDRDRSSVAAMIERNAEMMELVAKALTGLKAGSGFMMVEG